MCWFFSQYDLVQMSTPSIDSFIDSLMYSRPYHIFARWGLNDITDHQVERLLVSRDVPHGLQVLKRVLQGLGCLGLAIVVFVFEAGYVLAQVDSCLGKVVGKELVELYSADSFSFNLHVNIVSGNFLKNLLLLNFLLVLFERFLSVNRLLFFGVSARNSSRGFR